jgi:hypothetical protein
MPSSQRVVINKSNDEGVSKLCLTWVMASLFQMLFGILSLLCLAYLVISRGERGTASARERLRQSARCDSVSGG